MQGNTLKKDHIQTEMEFEKKNVQGKKAVKRNQRNEKQ